MIAIRTATVALLLPFLMLAACGRERSPEDQIRDVVTTAEKGAEARDLSEVMGLVSDRYSDLQGHDKAAVREIMRGYFLINQSIHLLTRAEDIRFETDDIATARVIVGMLGRQDDSAGDWSLAADVYEFDLRFLREGEAWRLQSATWRRAGN
ncbi:MAG TPA: hypothetical protein VLB75_01825 [Steroidobacteraceae bacterium]|nr:hypothetical protein [Steroidobacteraceae bacterium]